MNVIIWGANHNNTLGLVRSLGEANHHVCLLLYKSRINYVSKSKYVSELFYVNSNVPIVDQIICICQRLYSKPVVFTTSDDDAAYIIDHQKELLPYCFFENGGMTSYNLNKYRDKDKECRLAIECGFSTPRTWLIESPEGNDDIFPYPLLTKANNSINGGKSVLRIVNNLDELKHHLASIPAENYPIQIQEFIDKDYELMLLGCSLNGGETVLSPVAQRKIRFYPQINSKGSFSYSIDPSKDEKLIDLQKKVKTYLNTINYTGLFSAEFVYKYGTYYFLEINLRNDGTSYISTKSGYNLPNILCKFFEKGEFSCPACFKKCYYMVNMADIRHVFEGKLSLWAWWKDFRKTTCYSHYNKIDKKPYFWFVFSLFYEKLIK